MIGRAVLLVTVSLASLAALPASPALSQRISGGVSEIFAIGRNRLGEACTAQTNLRDAAIVDKTFDRSYVINCRSAAASRAIGSLRIVRDTLEARAAIEQTLICGEARPVSLKPAGSADARRCIDKTLDIPVVALRLTRGGELYVGTSDASSAGPLERGMAIALGLERPDMGTPRVAEASFDFETLPDTPGMASGSDAMAFNARNVLRQGIRLNQQGLFVDSSRLLNDALSRLTDMESDEMRGELELEAALADSNIGYFSTADSHFFRANALIGDTANPLLLRKLTIYRSLDLLNRRRFSEVLATLAQRPRLTKGGPLSDVVTLAQLNSSSGTPSVASSAVGGCDETVFSQIVVDSQSDWARSVAHAALGDLGNADGSLADALRSFGAIRNSSCNRVQISWLDARIQRQRGRLAMAKGDWNQAVGAFDAALVALRNASSVGASIAETQMDRADALSKRGANRQEVERDYATAIDTLLESRAAGAVQPTGVERYLGVLTDAGGKVTEIGRAEQFFRAVQAVGEPAVARQMAQLQSVVSADPALAAQIRERADVSQELTALRYEITQRQGTAGFDLGLAERRRDELQLRFQQINDALAGNDRFRTTEDRPVTVAEIQAALGEDEVFFKISSFKGKSYGIVIAKRAVTAYPIAAATPALARASAQLRDSIDNVNAQQTGQLPRYRVGLAATLFEQLAGPAREQLLSASRIVVDPSGPLEKIPLGVLVTDTAAARAFGASNQAKTGNYSSVPFLATQAEIAVALSPRSFLVARSLPPSRARNPFLGLGEHAAPTTAALSRPSGFSFGLGCNVGSQVVSEYYSYFEPIDKRELDLAASALRIGQAPTIVDEAFTDAAVLQRTDLDQYEVLHFATHGFEEGRWAGCPKAPPALLTSLGGEGSDGLLSFAEIASLRLDANLVVLSACETAGGVSAEAARLAGQEEQGATLEGLVRAFLTANARAVLATYWEASAEEDFTERLIGNFYSRGRTESIGGALRATQTALIRDSNYSHPFFWAPYFLVGDASKSMITQKSAQAAGATSRGAVH